MKIDSSKYIAIRNTLFLESYVGYRTVEYLRELLEEKLETKLPFNDSEYSEVTGVKYVKDTHKAKKDIEIRVVRDITNFMIPVIKELELDAEALRQKVLFDKVVSRKEFEKNLNSIENKVKKASTMAPITMKGLYIKIDTTTTKKELNEIHSKIIKKSISKSKRQQIMSNPDEWSTFIAIERIVIENYKENKVEYRIEGDTTREALIGNAIAEYVGDIVGENDEAFEIEMKKMKRLRTKIIDGYKLPNIKDLDWLLNLDPTYGSVSQENTP